MTIGVDLSPLQTPHRMRGIGFTLLNFINHIPASSRAEDHFVFFLFENGTQAALSLLDLSAMSYEVRHLKIRPEQILEDKFLPFARLRQIMRSVVIQLKDMLGRYFGNPLIKNTKGIDIFIQPDQSQSLPKGRMKKVLIIYDIIPYVLEWEYLWSYKTARVRGFSWKGALRCKARRWLYIKKLKINAKRADLMLAISTSTRHDFEKHVGAKAHKIKVVHLGVSEPDTENKDIELQRYHKTSWGYMSKPFKFDSPVPFILYVGGADRRRRIDDLVTAFNNLRGQGVKLNLVLCGDTMQGPENIATEEIQGALKTSSYLQDIIFTGFASDATRNWLYNHAAAFVYPSTYEGFGLPVLEAMIHGCPVVSYRNRAVEEVAGELPLYVANYEEMRQNILEILGYNSEKRATIKDRNMAQARKYQWSKTAQGIIKQLQILTEH